MPDPEVEADSPVSVLQIAVTAGVLIIGCVTYYLTNRARQTIGGQRLDNSNMDHEALRQKRMKHLNAKTAVSGNVLNAELTNNTTHTNVPVPMKRSGSDAFNKTSVKPDKPDDATQNNEAEPKKIKTEEELPVDDGKTHTKKDIKVIKKEAVPKVVQKKEIAPKVVQKKEAAKKDVQAVIAKPKSTEECLIEILSVAFDIVVNINTGSSSWKAGAFMVKPTDIKITTENLSLKCGILLDRRIALVFMSRVTWLFRSYAKTAKLREQYKDDELLASFITCLQQCMVDAVITSLVEDGSSDVDEDDLWSSVAHDSREIEKSEQLQFLLCLDEFQNSSAIRDDLLPQLIEKLSTHSKGTTVINTILQRCGAVVIKNERLESVVENHSILFGCATKFVSNPLFTPLISEILSKELKDFKNDLGSKFENGSCVGDLLGWTTIPSSVTSGLVLNSGPALYWTQAPGFPKIRSDDVRLMELTIHKGYGLTRGVVRELLKRVVKSSRDVAVDWLAALLNANENRSSVSLRVHKVKGAQPACSDGFMINVCSILLDLCMPFCKANMTAYADICHKYAASKHCPINYNFEPCLAGGQIVSDDLLGADDNYYTFKTIVFHFTARAMNIGYTTAIAQLRKATRVVLAQTQDDMKKRAVFYARWDCTLIEPELCRKATMFYLTVAKWIMNIISADKTGGGTMTAQQQREALSHVPEFMVKDMAHWFMFLLEHPVRAHKNLLTGIEVSPFVNCCVLLLNRPDLMPGPIPAYRIAQALSAFLDTSHTSSQTVSGAVNLGHTTMSDLSAIVHTCKSVQDDLCPALIHTYISVDVVEGLDVDKDDFDKYGARAVLSKLLSNLWERADCRESIIKLCGTEKFQDFLGCILGTLLYQIHDSLYRLTNIRRLQQAAEDTETWDKLTEKEKDDKKKWLKGEEKVAKGFLTMATKTLDLLSTLTLSEEVSRCFTVPPLAKRAASAFLGFLDALCGPKSLDLKVKDMDKYGFKPVELVANIVELLLRIVQQESSRSQGFVQSLSVDADYNKATLDKVLSVLTNKSFVTSCTIQHLQQLLKEIEILHDANCDSKSADNSGVSDADGVDTEETQEQSQEQLLHEYVEALGEHRYDTYDFEENHTFYDKSEQSSEASAQRTKALVNEMKQWPEDLPVHSNAAIFVRQDEDHMDLIRALVTGPSDTPYATGCFIFDIYFPATYPNIPPIVKLLTTGNGLVRFNPNLYADGKVCLSLLGTWHGGDSSQKWQPDTSTLYQVLLSIQSMILISEPMFNEPGYESIQDTAEGKHQCEEYNAKLRLYTARHAILEHLKNPPLGFEDVVDEHFRVQRHVIKKQLHDWLAQCTGAEDREKLQKATHAICNLLKRYDEAKEDETVKETNSETAGQDTKDETQDETQDETTENDTET